MKFSHPLARSAKVWPATAPDGSTQAVLVVITTLELDADHKSYKKDKVERLRSAAQEFVTHNAAGTHVLLMSRPKDWD